MAAGPRERRNQLWAAERLDDANDDWLLVLGFEVDNGVTDLASVTICPYISGEPHDLDPLLGRMARLLGPTLAKRHGRLTSRIVRSAAVSTLEREARAVAAQWAGRWFFESGQAGDAQRKPRRIRSGGDTRLAVVAARYLELTTVADDPVKQLADELGLARNTVSSYLWRARERRLLTSAGQGRPGGSLTDRGRQLLDDARAAE